MDQQNLVANSSLWDYHYFMYACCGLPDFVLYQFLKTFSTAAIALNQEKF